MFLKERNCPICSRWADARSTVYHWDKCKGMRVLRGKSQAVPWPEAPEAALWMSECAVPIQVPEQELLLQSLKVPLRQ